MIVETYFKNRAPLALKNRHSLLLRRGSHGPTAKSGKSIRSATSSGFATPVLLDSENEGSSDFFGQSPGLGQEKSPGYPAGLNSTDSSYARSRKRHHPHSSLASAGAIGSNVAPYSNRGDFTFEPDVFSDLARAKQPRSNLGHIAENANGSEDVSLTLDMEQICAENNIDVDELIAAFRHQSTSPFPPLDYQPSTFMNPDPKAATTPTSANLLSAPPLVPAQSTTNPLSYDTAPSRPPSVTFSWPTTPPSSGHESGPVTPYSLARLSPTPEASVDYAKKRITLTAHCPEAELGAFVQSIMTAVNSMAGGDRDAGARGITLDIE